MSGVALVIVSPSISRTSRNTPCVAGCDGPMFRTIFSPMSSRVSAGARIGRGDASNGRLRRFDFAGDKCHRNFAFMLASGARGASAIWRPIGCEAPNLTCKAKDGRCVLGAWREAPRLPRAADGASAAGPPRQRRVTRRPRAQLTSPPPNRVAPLEGVA